LPGAISSPDVLPPLARLIPLLLAGRPALAGEALPPVSARLGFSWEGQRVPPFWVEPRDRATASLQATVQPDPRLGFGLDLDIRRWDARPEGTVSGPGDLSLHSWGRLWRGPVPGGFATWVKLPNADDLTELGTDETDLHLAATAGSRRGAASLRAWLGLASLGDPFSGGGRTWLPEGEARFGWELGPVEAVGRLSALPGGPRPRPIGSLALSLEARCPLLAGAELSHGLASSGPSPGLRAWLGWASGCTSEPEEEARCCDGPLPGR